MALKRALSRLIQPVAKTIHMKPASPETTGHERELSGLFAAVVLGIHSVGSRGRSQVATVGNQFEISRRKSLSLRVTEFPGRVHMALERALFSPVNPTSESRNMKLAGPEITIKEHTSQGLSFLWLEITQKCNLTCQHCYAGSSPSRPLSNGMDTHDWMQVISESSALNCRAIQFIGGEPTLCPDLPQLIQHARRSGFEMVEVFTNATTLTESRLQLFRNEHVNIACSFYSDDETVHDSITQQRGSFSRTRTGITKALEYGLDLRVGIIEMGLNYGHHDRAASLLRSMGVTRISGDRIRAVGRGTTSELPKLPEYGDICGRCWQGKLCVTDSGDTYPCIMARKIPVGNFLRNSLHEILESRSLIDFRDNVRVAFQRFEVTNCGPDCTPRDYCGPVDGCNPKTPCYPSQICNPTTQCVPGT